MRLAWGGFLSLAALALSGCAGVPRLYKAAPGPNGANELAPKVKEIVHEITCELTNLSHDHLSERPYLITANLTLQVNDEIGVTPSLAFIRTFSGDKGNLTVNENLGISGARERTFTATFHFDSDDLRTKPHCTEEDKKLYRLDGNLGLAEIARDGIGIRHDQLGLQGLKPPSEASFGSQVKFVVTRAVTAFGPTWTLSRFKGPGGAAGLINGKALNTDTLVIAFAAKKTDPTLEEQQLQVLQRAIVLLEELARTTAADAARKKAAFNEARRVQGAEVSILKAGPRKDRLQAFIERAGEDAAQAAQRSEQARSQFTRAQADLEGALSAARASRARADNDALDTNRGIINTLILQNLSTLQR